jgi:hypothetical protein
MNRGPEGCARALDQRALADKRVPQVNTATENV